MDSNERRVELLQKLVLSQLKMGGAPEDLQESLSDPINVLEKLEAGNNDWATVYAAGLHIELADGFLAPLVTRFREEAYTVLEDIVFDSESDKPAMELNLKRGPVIFEHRPEWSRYFHSRVALARLVEKDQAARRIQLLEPLRELFPPRTNDMLSRDISYGGRLTYRGMLRQAYEDTERYIDALEILLGGGRLTTLANNEEFELADAYFTG